MSRTSIEEFSLEPVYIAGNVREVKLLERLLDEEGIEFEVRPCQFEHAISFGDPALGLLFEVRSGQALCCRKLFAERCFVKGLVPQDVEDI